MKSKVFMIILLTYSKYFASNFCRQLTVSRNRFYQQLVFFSIFINFSKNFPDVWKLYRLSSSDARCGPWRYPWSACWSPPASPRPVSAASSVQSSLHSPGTGTRPWAPVQVSIIVIFTFCFIFIFRLAPAPGDIPLWVRVWRLHDHPPLKRIHRGAVRGEGRVSVTSAQVLTSGCVWLLWGGGGATIRQWHIRAARAGQVLPGRAVWTRGGVPGHLARPHPGDPVTCELWAVTSVLCRCMTSTAAPAC